LIVILLLTLGWAFTACQLTRYDSESLLINLN
jgi:hypothetical protein